MTHQIALAFEDGITKFIPCAPDQTVADAAYQARINIPFDCRDGACGTCKAFCEAGDFDEGTYVDEALSPAEAAEGFCLPCQIKPYSDLVLQIRTTSVLAKTEAAPHRGMIGAVERLSASTYRLVIELSQPLSFLPGQYVNIEVPGSGGQTRSYSMSNAPGSARLEFLVKHAEGGLMTSYLADTAAVGDEITLTGPMGSFFLREPLDPILLLAGGTGLAPILAILEGLAADELLDQPVRLIYGASFDHDLVELERLAAFRERIADFDFLTVISDSASAHERLGYVTDHLTDEHTHEDAYDVYLCGPPPMVEAVRTDLNSRPSPPARFFYEKFTPQTVTAKV